MNFISKIFLAEFFKKLAQLIREIKYEMELEKQVKEKVKEIQNEQDAQTRAKRMRDLLNS